MGDFKNSLGVKIMAMSADRPSSKHPSSMNMSINFVKQNFLRDKRAPMRKLHQANNLREIRMAQKMIWIAISKKSGPIRMTQFEPWNPDVSNILL